MLENDAGDENLFAGCGSLEESHCGYSVRPFERRKGYAKEMLRLNLQNAKNLGIDKMLVTCDCTNIASERTILDNGGEFERIIDVDDTKMKR